MIPFLLLAVLLLAGAGLLIFHPTRAASADRPNVVVIMSDDQDIDSLPVMRKLLASPEGSWVRFANAFSNTSICTPARGTLLTGQYAHNHGAVGNNWGSELDDSNTLAVWLDNAGYHTAVIGKYLHEHPAVTIGDGSNMVPGWDHYLMSENTVDHHTQMAVDFLTAGDESPFFLWLALRSPHIPAVPAPRYADADVYVPPDRSNFNEADMSDKPPHMRRLPLLSASTIAELRAERLNSQRELLAIDDSIETIVHTLRDMGRLDNTLLIFVGDNGFSWGSHREYEKLCPYEECSRVPLFIRYPGAADRIETRFVSMVDLAPTILEYTGVAPGLPQDGRSLIPLLSGAATEWADAVLIEKAYGSSGYYAARAPGWLYAEYKSGDRELYDLTADPYQLNNVAGRAAYAAAQDEMDALLDALLADSPPPPPATPTPTATPPPPPPPAGPLALSWATAVDVGGLGVAPEDIAAYDAAAGTWALLFDGSAAGAGTNVDGFERLPDGSLLLTFDAPATLPGVGPVDDSDVARFVAGPGGGAWSLYLDGSDVGLTTAAEDIDALAVLPGGDLLVGTRGKAAVPGARAAPHDLLRFHPTQTGADTAGAWALYFDGSDVGLSTSGENVTGVSVAADGRLYLSTTGAFRVAGLSGGRADVFICAPLSVGPTTACDFGGGFAWRGATQGPGGAAIDGVGMGE